VIPDAVVKEVSDGQAKDPTATTALSWAERYRVTDIVLPASIEHWDLGSGESQVIAHATLEPRWAVLDDRAARRCSAAHNVPVIGSLGVALRCKSRAG
jgi:predicted nucleic acid-binding protein